jgi:hypothetical protein
VGSLAAQNTVRSNRSASAIADLSDTLTGESVLRGADTDGDGDYDSFTGMGTIAAISTELTRVGSLAAQNTVRSNRSASAIADLSDTLTGEGYGSPAARRGHQTRGAPRISEEC